ncbi:hypothetical protein GCM10011502_29470 [Oceanisphaera marina]|uniref:Glycosyl hydrolase n=1 Tax=Oceanisphaera marina TaxID=2017550 RepID=A0ABQ1J0U3_9GAMM|nr:hypothetical protein [Oceanisphaera marina]GGB54510.1 hypothetical protein GCM10011502_29470 [Oceanisphaera marina]
MSEPEIIFRDKTEAELNEPNSRAEVTEDWMADAAERANRRSLSIIKGFIDGPVTTVLLERAQYGDWWIAPDWRTVYVHTQWRDRRIKSSSGEQLFPTQKLWKSTDAGEYWQQLTWPEADNITFLRFLDAERGYLIGSGPRLWRTQDGGEHWQEIALPAIEPYITFSEQFDLVALGADNTLRLAYFTARYGKQENLSVVLALPWGDDTPEVEFTVPDQSVIDLLADEAGKVHVLGWQGLPVNYSIPDDSKRERPSMISMWDGAKLQPLHEFKKDVIGYALYRTPAGHILFDGVTEGFLPNDITALSTDGGKRWQMTNEGSSAQGGYYDTHTGTRWRVSGYALSKREIP